MQNRRNYHERAMLLRFTCQNYKSFLEEVSLSMVASSDERHSSHILKTPAGPAAGIVRAAGIYGANAHGKTKLVDAIGLLKTLVVEGVDADESLVETSFALDPDARSSPTRLIAEFQVEGVGYEYGVVVSPEMVHEEWLFEIRNSRSKRVFERSTRRDPASEGYISQAKFGDMLIDEAKSKPNIKSGIDFLNFIVAGMHAPQTLIRELSIRNIKSLSNVIDWFKVGLVIVNADSHYAPLSSRAQTDPEFMNFMSEFISDADTGIDHLAVREVPFDFSSMDVGSDRREQIRQDIESGDTYRMASGDGSFSIIKKNDAGVIVKVEISTQHKSSDGSTIAFELNQESSGTIRLLHLGPMLADLKETKKTYVVDELDRKLHPLLAYKFIETFLNVEGCGQLVFTTHNTHLMDLELLRRDEIWFVQKKSDNSSTLYSLSDLRVRPDLNIEKSYMHGRFGGIPHLTNLGDEARHLSGGSHADES